jgi:nucleotide-binding universal stress UspA family protein
MTADHTPERDPDPRRRVFLSYARADEEKVAALEDGLRKFGADVWRDRSLVGGQAWWDEILDQIRRCDVFVQGVSAAGIESEACRRERAYARELGKHVLPVCVGAVDMDELPDDLARLQVVESDDPYRVLGALASYPPAPQLPEPLPDPPDVPVSYLHSLRDKVRAASLTLDEQLALVARLEEALDDEEESDRALGLLEKLDERDDLYEVTARRIERLLGSEPPPDHDDRPKPEPPPPPPEPRTMSPAAVATYTVGGAAVMGLAGGWIREASDPDGGSATAEIVALAFARTIGWALIVAVVAAVIARSAGSSRPSRAAWRGLVAGAVTGLAGGLVHGVLQWRLDVDPGTSRLVGLAITGALTGAYLGRSLRAPAAGLVGGLVGGLAAGLLVMDWPGPGAEAPVSAASWIVHAVPICAAAVGLAMLLGRPARVSEPVASMGPPVYR